MTLVPRTVAVVVNWNGWSWTRRCLDDLGRNDPPVGIVAVDNGSTDGSRELLRSRAGPGFEVVLLPSNLGFAAGMNVGITRALASGCEFLWLLNNDVRVPADCHARLLRTAIGEEDATVWTPRLTSPTGSDQHVGGSYACDGSWGRLHPLPAFLAAPPHGLWITATALFCRASTASRIGRFDEAFFAYWEDVDWSFRARRAGIRLSAVPDAVVTHHRSQATGGQTSPVSTFLLARNELLFLRKHVSARRARTAMIRVVARQLRWAIILERRGFDLTVQNVLAGVLAGLLGQSGRPRWTSLPRPLVQAALFRPLLLAHWLDRLAHFTEPVMRCGQDERSDSSSRRA
jgi:GT2 family glycosyltransferase